MFTRTKSIPVLHFLLINFRVQNVRAETVKNERIKACKFIKKHLPLHSQFGGNLK